MKINIGEILYRYKLLILWVLIVSTALKGHVL